jgi:hypothetical protein
LPGPGLRSADRLAEHVGTTRALGDLDDTELVDMNGSYCAPSQTSDAYRVGRCALNTNDDAELPIVAASGLLSMLRMNMSISA